MEITTKKKSDIEKSPERIEILNKIEFLEKTKQWNVGVEPDLPSLPLRAEDIDYTRKHIFSKFKTLIANFIGWRFITSLIKNKKLIISEINGLENYEQVRNLGVILTCNHFNAFDNFAILVSLDKYLRHHVMWKVIREGNYTSFKGFYGYLFRNCNTLPLSSNFSCQKKFMSAISELLKRNEKILIYPEQEMWWNYKKPRPVTPGAYRFAVSNNVPILPIFITMKDTSNIGEDGFPIQEYTLHFLPAIYPDDSKSVKENVRFMMEKNYTLWKETYEKVYGIPLTYTK